MHNHNDSTKPQLILIAGPYRSGTDDDPQRMAANLETLERALREVSVSVVGPSMTAAEAASIARPPAQAGRAASPAALLLPSRFVCG